MDSPEDSPEVTTMHKNLLSKFRQSNSQVYVIDKLVVLGMRVNILHGYCNFRCDVSLNRQVIIGK